MQVLRQQLARTYATSGMTITHTDSCGNTTTHLSPDHVINHINVNANA